MNRKKNAIRLSFITLAALMLLLGAPAAVFHGVQSDLFAPATVYAGNDHQIGATGSDVTWELVDVSGGKKLVISGTGAIDESLFSSSKSPWKSDKDNIVEVEVQDGITSIPKYFLCQMSNLTSIYFSKDIKDFTKYAIYNCKSLTVLRFTEGLETIQETAVFLCSDLNKIYFSDSLTNINTYAFSKTANSYSSGSSMYSGTYYGLSSNEAIAAYIAAVNGNFCDIRCEAGHDFLVSCDDDGFHTVCSVCGKVAVMATDKVINDITVPDATYYGSAVTPSVTVHFNGKYNVLESKYYDVTYEDNDMAGIGYAVVTFKDGFSGTIRVPFVIKPSAPTGVECQEIEGGFRVCWDAPENNADKYVVSYWNSFDGTKTVTVSGDERSADIFGQYTGQLCSVKVIAYKTIDGEEYSAESAEVESCFGGKAVAGPNNVKLPAKKTVTVGFKTPLSLTYDKFNYKLDKSKLKWSTSNKKIATVDKNGVVNAKKKGKCKIYCTYAGKKMTMTLTVGANVYNKGTKLSQLDPYSSYQRYVELYPNKLSYNKKGKLVLKVALVNRRMFKANKFKWITITVKDKKGRVIAKQKFKNKKINCKKYGKKYITFTFNKGTKKKVDLRTQFDYMDYDYYYTFSY